MRFEMADYKDIAADTFLTSLRKLQERIVGMYDKMQRLATPELYAAILNLEEYAKTLGLGSMIDELMLSFDDALKGIQSFASVPEETLQALKKIEHQALLNKSKVEIDVMKREIFRAIATKTWNKKEIIKSLHEGIGGALSDKQIETEITTALSNFERNVTANMMAEMPDDTKYFYLGPVDDKTRDACVSMADAGELTKKEIIAQFGADVLEVGGGYNCRHRWSLAV